MKKRDFSQKGQKNLVIFLILPRERIFKTKGKEQEGGQKKKQPKQKQVFNRAGAKLWGYFFWGQLLAPPKKKKPVKVYSHGDGK